MVGMIEIIAHGERVQLLPEHAMYLPAHNAVVVADVHWGKASTFRAFGVPVPSGSTRHDLTRLSRVLHETRASTLIIVGDLLHAKRGRSERLFAELAAWREQHSQVAMILVRGNHDARAGDPPGELRITCVDGPIAVGSLTLQHHPAERPEQFIVAGHLHPSVVLRGRARQRMRLPCFVVREQLLVLPAFTAFSGGGMFALRTGDKIFAIVQGEVVRLDPSS